MIRFYCILIYLIPVSIFAQSGPGGVGNSDGNSDLSLWVNLDSIDFDQLPRGLERWEDRSGKSNHLLSNAATSQPSVVLHNGYPAIYFDGNDYVQMRSFTADFNNTEQSIFAVVSETNDGAIASIAKGEWNNEFLVFNNAVYHHTYSGNFTYRKHDCLIGNEPLNIITAQFGSDPNELSIKVNNTVSNVPIVTEGNPKEYGNVNRKVTLGQRGKLAFQEYLSGYIYEVIVFNRELNAIEIAKVQRYLRCKYRGGANYCSSFSEEIDCNDEFEIPCEQPYALHPTLTNDFTIMSPFEENVNVRIYNSIGQLVAVHEPLSDPRILLYGLSPDVYYFQIFGDCGTRTIKVIRIQ